MRPGITVPVPSPSSALRLLDLIQRLLVQFQRLWGKGRVIRHPVDHVLVLRRGKLGGFPVIVFLCMEVLLSVLMDLVVPFLPGLLQRLLSLCRALFEPGGDRLFPVRGRHQFIVSDLLSDQGLFINDFAPCVYLPSGNGPPPVVLIVDDFYQRIALVASICFSPRRGASLGSSCGFGCSGAGGFTVAESLSAAFFRAEAFGAFALPPVALSGDSFQTEVFFGGTGSFVGAAFLSARAFACSAFGGRPLQFDGSAVLSGLLLTYMV